MFTRKDEGNCRQGREQQSLLKTDNYQATMTCLCLPQVMTVVTTSPEPLPKPGLK
jgi:hypothetical protein